MATLYIRAPGRAARRVDFANIASTFAEEALPVRRRRLPSAAAVAILLLIGDLLLVVQPHAPPPTVPAVTLG